jgi:hypothetical protein
MDAITICMLSGWITLHSLALVAAWGTRVATSRRTELAVQCCFLAAMLAVGSTAWVCHQRGLGLWVPSAVTLVAMVLTAVTDLPEPGESAPTLGPSAGR